MRINTAAFTTLPHDKTERPYACDITVTPPPASGVASGVERRKVALGVVGTIAQAKWSPGNATEYDLILVQIKSDTVLVCWLHVGAAYQFSLLPYADYLGQKMHLRNMADAEAIATFLQHVCA